jgi:hypothetical protein
MRPGLLVAAMATEIELQERSANLKANFRKFKGHESGLENFVMFNDCSPQ